MHPHSAHPRLAIGLSPLVLIHGFHQLAAGLGLVLAVALRGWDVEIVPTRRSRLAASAAAIVVFAGAAPAVTRLIELESEVVALRVSHTLTRLGPLVVAILSGLGLYAYGYERSFSRRALRAMVEAAGFAPVAETGILFVPGWLRMLELLCRRAVPRLSPPVRVAVRPFMYLSRWARLRRHGYLVVCVGEKPRA